MYREVSLIFHNFERDPKQARDSEIISKTNNRTRSIFGESAMSKQSRLPSSDKEAGRIFEGSEKLDQESQKSSEQSSGNLYCPK